MNPPQRIYLQVGPDCTPEELLRVDWNSGEVTWASERVYSTDIEYELVDPRDKRKAEQ